MQTGRIYTNICRGKQCRQGGYILIYVGKTMQTGRIYTNICRENNADREDIY